LQDFDNHPITDKWIIMYVVLPNEEGDESIMTAPKEKASVGCYGILCPKFLGASKHEDGLSTLNGT
jgi:hypothetical protein